MPVSPEESHSPLQSPADWHYLLTTTTCSSWALQLCQKSTFHSGTCQQGQLLRAQDRANPCYSPLWGHSYVPHRSFKTSLCSTFTQTPTFPEAMGALCTAPGWAGLPDLQCREKRKFCLDMSQKWLGGTALCHVHPFQPGCGSDIPLLHCI